MPITDALIISASSSSLPSERYRGANTKPGICAGPSGKAQRRRPTKDLRLPSQDRCSPISAVAAASCLARTDQAARVFHGTNSWC
jgi:hypothetical protein